LRNALPRRVPLVQVAKLYPQHCGLKLVESGNGAVLLADVALTPAVHPQPPSAFCRNRVPGNQHARVAQRPEVLGWIEAERRGIAKGADQTTAEAGAMRLRAVFEHFQS